MTRLLRSSLIVFCMVSANAFAAGMLDGKRFIGESGPMGSPADQKGDVITFADGRFHSSSCDQWGFSKGDYTATQDGDVVRFEVTTVSETDGRLQWKGVVKGDTLEGGFVHYRKPSFFSSKPKPIEHWLKAQSK